MRQSDRRTWYVPFHPLRDGNDIATERKAVVFLDVNLVDKSGKLVRQLAKLTDEEAYKVSDNRTTTENNKQNALLTVSKRMAETVYEKLNEY